MRLFSIILLLFLLLSGCSAGPVPSSHPSVPTVPETEPQSTEADAAEPVLPPDPMQMLLSAMTLEEKVGQLFLIRCREATALEDIAAFHPGGILLFGQDFDAQTPSSIRQKLQDYQFASPIPLLLAVDEEGGTVCRISNRIAFRPSRFPAPRESYAAGGMEQVLAVESEKSAFLRDLGINVNMAPVCDITDSPTSFMYARSLGESPEETGRFISAAVQIQKSQGISGVLKHFPGYGNNADTHTDSIRDSRPLTDLEERDLVPFAAGIAAGADAILVSHTVVEAMDAEFPASLSPAVHDYLRDTMEFSGVIVTDDLVMEAITKAYGPEEAAVLAVLAGNDLLCSSEYTLQYPAVLEAVQTGQISMEQLDESVMRILQWKRELGLIF